MNYWFFVVPIFLGGQSLHAQCLELSHIKGEQFTPGTQKLQPWKRVGEGKMYALARHELQLPLYQPSSLLLIPKWSANDLPFFCRIEHQWAKQRHIPLKFRLGSVEYVDWLEGK